MLHSASSPREFLTRGRAGNLIGALFLLGTLFLPGGLVAPAVSFGRVSVIDTSRTRSDTVSYSSDGITVIRNRDGKPDTLVVGRGRGHVQISHRGVIVDEGDGGDRVRMGDDITIEPNESVSGDVVAIGGTVRIMGTVQGDAVAIGGDMILGDSAVVGGDAVSIGGETITPPGSRVGGETVTIGVSLPSLFHLGKGRGVSQVEKHDSPGRAFVRLLFWVVFYLVVLAFAALCVAVSRDRIQFAADYMRQEPLITFLLGIFSPLLFLVGFILLLITIIGIPVALALLFVFPVLIFLGWVVAGYRVGSSIRQNPEMSVRTVFIGLTVISAVHLLSILLRTVGVSGVPIFLLGFLGYGASFLAALIGLGAILGTRFRRPAVAPALGGYPSAPPPPIGGGPITSSIDPAAPTAM